MPVLVLASFLLLAAAPARRERPTRCDLERPPANRDFGPVAQLHEWVRDGEDLERAVYRALNHFRFQYEDTAPPGEVRLRTTFRRLDLGDTSDRYLEGYVALRVSFPRDVGSEPVAIFAVTTLACERRRLSPAARRVESEPVRAAARALAAQFLRVLRDGAPTGGAGGEEP